MNKVISITLLFCMLLPFWGMFTWLQWEKYCIRKHVKHKVIHNIPRENLSLLRFSHEEARQQLHWEHEGEFVYQGTFYDVVYREIRQDSSLFWCYEDRQETYCYQHIQQLFTEAIAQHTTHQEQTSSLIKWFELSYLSVSTDHLNAIFCCFSVGIPFQPQFYYSMLPAPPSPPPVSSLKYRHAI